MKRLFNTPNGGIPWEASIVFFLLYLSMAAGIAGIHMASGLLVPFIIIGAALGRTMGVAFNIIMTGIDPEYGINTGNYALLGAGAFLGGTTQVCSEAVCPVVSTTVCLTQLLSALLDYCLPVSTTTVCPP